MAYHPQYQQQKSDCRFDQTPLFSWPGFKGEARRAAPDRPLGRARLQRRSAELQWELLNHKVCRTNVAAPARRSDAAL